MTAEEARAWTEGYLAALDDVQKNLAGEDSVEWARDAHRSSLSLSYAMEIVDAIRGARCDADGLEIPRPELLSHSKGEAK